MQLLIRLGSLDRLLLDYSNGLIHRLTWYSHLIKTIRANNKLKEKVSAFSDLWHFSLQRQPRNHLSHWECLKYDLLTTICPIWKSGVTIKNLKIKIVISLLFTILRNRQRKDSNFRNSFSRSQVQPSFFRNSVFAYM